jgi:hypothetical protein
MSDAESDSNSSEEPPLPCTLCAVDLSHPLLKACYHRQLQVALCLKCHQNLDRVEQLALSASEEPRCTWCGSGGQQVPGVQYDNLCRCRKEDCRHTICVACLERNFQAEKCDAIIRKSRSRAWKCLCCEKKPLRRLRNDLKARIPGSHYAAVAALQDSSDTGRIAILLELLHALVLGTDEAHLRLTEECLDASRLEFETEFRSRPGQELSGDSSLGSALERSFLEGMAHIAEDSFDSQSASSNQR